MEKDRRLKLAAQLGELTLVITRLSLQLRQCQQQANQIASQLDKGENNVGQEPEPD